MLFALLTLACSSVDLGEAGTFGPVLSAHWYLQDELAVSYGFEGDGPYPFLLDTLVLRDYAWSCDAERAYLNEWVSLSEAALAAEDADTRCAALGEVARHVAGKRDRYNRMSVMSESYVGTTPTEGATDAGAYVILNADDGDDGEDCGFWNPDTCSYDAADDACGQGDVYLYGQVRVRIDATTDTSVRGTVSGDLENRESGEVSPVEASFSATICDIPTLAPIIFP